MWWHSKKKKDQVCLFFCVALKRKKDFSYGNQRWNINKTLNKHLSSHQSNDKAVTDFFLLPLTFLSRFGVVNLLLHMCSLQLGINRRDRLSSFSPFGSFPIFAFVPVCGSLWCSCEQRKYIFFLKKGSNKVMQVFESNNGRERMLCVYWREKQTTTIATNIQNNT